MWEKLKADPNKVEKFPLGIDASVVIPLIRKVMPSVIAQDIVGVQPMSLPEGVTFEDVGKSMETFLNGGNETTSNTEKDT